jgi:mono/diheme cytochrome c family protein
VALIRLCALGVLLAGCAADSGRPPLCGRGHSDLIARAFCDGPSPELRGLADLQRLIGLDFVPGNDLNGALGNPAFALTGNSSSLVAQLVSSVNPRAILFTADTGPARKLDGDFVAMGFVRGEQFVELVSKDVARGDLTFFLFRFEQACNATPGGCSPAALFTPAVERDFTGWSIADDFELRNSTLDCLQCHQPDGPGTRKLLRMQELQDPWTHWLRRASPGRGNQPEGGEALLAQFLAAHGGEDYAGIPAAALPGSDPLRLEAFLESTGFAAQPNEFLSRQIEAEVANSSALQPRVNVPAGASPTWNQLYANAREGRAIPPPYHDVQVTDPVKLEAFTSGYLASVGGDASATFPTGLELFLPSALPELSFVPQPGLDGRGLLVQACQQCHQPALDPTISRARFDVPRLLRGELDREEENRAIQRLTLPASSPAKMPPPRFRSLSEEEIARLTLELSR